MDCTNSCVFSGLLGVSDRPERKETPVWISSCGVAAYAAGIGGEEHPAVGVVVETREQIGPVGAGDAAVQAFLLVIGQTPNEPPNSESGQPNA